MSCGDRSADVARLLASAAVLHGPAWLPLLGPIVSDATYAQLTRKYALTRPCYGTVRVRLSCADAERTVARQISAPRAFGRDLPIIVEHLPPAIAARYEELGLELGSGGFVSSPAVAARIDAALQVIAAVPSLARTIGQVLDVLHVAVPEGADFDVSFSDPEVPFSIFVGIAERDDSPVAALRLAEGIVHESMHLLLSLVEACVPLVADASTMLPSPWREELRPIGGVLHGAYVFTVIRELMAALPRVASLDALQAHHVSGRVAHTFAEVTSALSSLRATDGLTPAGVGVLDLIARSRARTSLPSLAT